MSEVMTGKRDNTVRCLSSPFLLVFMCFPSSSLPVKTKEHDDDDDKHSAKTSVFFFFIFAVPLQYFCYV